MSCLSNDRALSYKYIHIIYTYMHTSAHHLSTRSNPVRSIAQQITSVRKKKKSTSCRIKNNFPSTAHLHNQFLVYIMCLSNGLSIVNGHVTLTINLRVCVCALRHIFFPFSNLTFALHCVQRRWKEGRNGLSPSMIFDDATYNNVSIQSSFYTLFDYRYIIQLLIKSNIFNIHL